MSASVLLTALALVAREEGCADDFILTVETGPIGGITSQGIAFGANREYPCHSGYDVPV